jgi:hypothetical protein
MATVGVFILLGAVSVALLVGWLALFQSRVMVAPDPRTFGPDVSLGEGSRSRRGHTASNG